MTARTNTMTGAEAMVNMLEANGHRHEFGLSSDTTLTLLQCALQTFHGIDQILARNERSIAFSADGYARVTRNVGVCEGLSGGAAYMLPGLVEANESPAPVLTVTSDVGTRPRGHYTLIELDQESPVRPLAGSCAVIQHAGSAGDLVRTTFRKMTTGRPGAAHLASPIDMQRGEARAEDIWAEPAQVGFPVYPGGPDLARLKRYTKPFVGAHSRYRLRRVRAGRAEGGGALTAQANHDKG